MKYFLLLFITITQFSCKGQDDIKINLLLENKSNVKIDSVIIYFFDATRTYHDIKPREIKNLEFSIKKEALPKGESGVFAICAFKDDYYYTTSSGLIGFPYSKLEKEYSFYLWENGITLEKDKTPRANLPKEKLSEFRK